MKPLYFLIFLFLMVASCKKEQPFESDYPVDKKLVIENQLYGNNIRNVMDIYLSKNRTNDTKTIIFIHGGGWKAGDKSDFKYFASFFSDSGINTITMNYRYADASNEIDYNEILADIGKAISFIKSNSKKYGSNFNEITLFGASAGGHLALLYAYKCGNIKSVISLAGPTDFNDEAILSINGMPELVNNVVGNSSYEKRSEASPITHVNNTTTLLYHGKLDTIVPYSQSEKLFKKISALNPENKLTLFANCGHEFNDENIFNVCQETIDLVRK
jgi:acetyl esterase/lipase